jgi:hypothetical protein
VCANGASPLESGGDVLGMDEMREVWAFEGIDQKTIRPIWSDFQAAGRPT